MTELIHISQVQNDQWIETSPVRGDGKREFRERPKFGNRHAIFPINSEWGEAHIDEYNALDFPNGTVNHLAKYSEELTGIPEAIGRTVLVLGGLILGAKLLQYLEEQ